MFAVGKIDLQTFAGFRAWTLVARGREKSGKSGEWKGTRKYRIARRVVFVGKHTLGGEGEGLS